MNIIVDTETSGPAPMFGDLIEFAAIAENGATYKSEKLKPIFDKYNPKTYDLYDMTREDHEKYEGDVAKEFIRFNEWVLDVQRPAAGRPTFWSDNPAFDWQFINFGFLYAGLINPFGWSGRRIGDLYSGAKGNIRDHSSWKGLRVTRHTHDPLDDAVGNMEAFKAIRERYGL